MKRILNAAVLCMLAGGFVSALNAAETEYWPTWRGPDMMGISPDGNPPLTWSETENVKWKVKLTGDRSNSSPVIWEDNIFFQTAVQTDRKPDNPQPGGRGAPENIYKFNLVCLDRQTGQVKWEKTVTEQKPHQGHHADHGYASFSPVTDGSHIWAFYGSYGMYCYDMEGNEVWKKEMAPMTTRFGEANSPALAGDRVIVTFDHEGDSFIYAFDKKTGDIRWQKARDEGTSHASPFVIEGYGPTQVVASATGKIRSYNVDTGDVIWECGGMTRNVIPTPVMGFDKVYCTSGFRGSALLAIELGHTGDLTDTEAIAWKVDEATPYVPSILLYDQQLYVLSVNNAIVSCYNAQTGDPYYLKQPFEEMKDIYASPVGAAGRVYFVGRNGVTYVLKNGESFDVLAVNKLDDEIDCSPAVIGDEMYLKGKQYLYCLKADDADGD